MTLVIETTIIKTELFSFTVSKELTIFKQTKSKLQKKYTKPSNTIQSSTIYKLNKPRHSR